MPITDALAAVPEQVLDTIAATQDFVVTTVTTVAEATKPLIEKLPAPPFADRLPNPAGVVESTFAAAEKLLANQKDLSLKLLDTYLPAKTPRGTTRPPKTA